MTFDRRSIIRSLAGSLPAAALLSARVEASTPARALGRYYPGDDIPAEGGGFDTHPRVLVRSGQGWEGEENWHDISNIVKWASPEAGELGLFVHPKGGSCYVVMPDGPLESVAKVNFRLVKRDAE